jgi:hypothetical protein
MVPSFVLRHDRYKMEEEETIRQGSRTLLVSWTGAGDPYAVQHQSDDSTAAWSAGGGVFQFRRPILSFR